MDMIRDSAFGQIVRLFARRKALQYPEEQPGFDADRYYNIVSSTVPESGSERVTPFSPVDDAFSSENRKSQSRSISKSQLIPSEHQTKQAL